MLQSATEEITFSSEIGVHRCASVADSSYRSSFLRASVAKSLSRGFTLIELSVVMFIIAIVCAVAFPRFLPIIAFSQVEGASRHVANYGRAAIAQAALMKEDVTFYFDLDKQQFWCTRLVYPADQEGEYEAEMPLEGESEDQLAMLNEFQQQGGYSSAEISKMLSSGRGASGLNGMKQMSGMGGMNGMAGLPQGFDMDLAGEQVGDKFDRMARRQLEARAKNVVPDASFMDQIGPLFDKKFSLDGNGEDEEPYEEEIKDPVLRRGVMPEEVSITEVEVNGERYKKGTVSVPISPLGLEDEVIFYLANADGNVYTVLWDPVLNNTDIIDGRYEP